VKVVNMTCGLIIILLSLVSALEASFIFDTADVAVTTGETLELKCGVKQDFRYCVWENEKGYIYQVEDVHAGVHAGMRAPEDLTDNQCGVVIDSIGAQDLGAWTCKVHLAGRTLVGSRNVGKTNMGPCDESFVLLGQECYYFHESSHKSWQDAREYCRSMTTLADLAVVDECHELALIWDHVIMYHNATWHWIGGSDLGQEGYWYFVDASPVPVGTPFWRPGNPSDDGNCLDLSEPYGYFNDYDCEKTGHFICQQIFL
ncbi:hypothetical protein OTU49_015724, partial [Cherax quadricarinatus]